MLEFQIVQIQKLIFHVMYILVYVVVVMYICMYVWCGQLNFTM